MQLFVAELVQQATDVSMMVNGNKTKELLIGSAIKDPPPPVNLGGMLVERVTTLQLMGVHVASDLKWSQHIDAIRAKAASRLHFLKQLKRSDARCDDLLYFYVTVIRTVLEYACPVWKLQSHRHTDEGIEITAAQSDARHFPGQRLYTMSLIKARLETLESRRNQLTKRFFQRSVLPETSCLHYLLLDKRDSSVTDRLRHPRNFETIKSRTVKFQNSLILYLVHYLKTLILLLMFSFV